MKIPFAATRVFPKAYYEKVGQDGFRAAPIGTGPYKFAKWVPKTSMEFDANPDYWGASKPQWAHIIETLVPEEATRVAQLQRGDVDIIGNLVVRPRHPAQEQQFPPAGESACRRWPTSASPARS